MNTSPTSRIRSTGSYTIINHTARLTLHLSITEYCVFDLIAHLAENPKNTGGWCYASKETIAEYFSIGRATVFRAIKKGLATGLLEKHPEQPELLKTTERWSHAMGITQEKRLKMIRQPSHNDTPKRLKMIRNNNTDNNIYNNTVKKKVEEKTSPTRIGDILARYQLPKKGAASMTRWHVEAQRLWKGLALPGTPSHPFYQLVKKAYQHGEQQKLLRAFSYCQDATGVYDKERLLYWRYANDHTPVIRNHSVSPESV